MTIKKLLFSFQGRINRAKYWGGIVGLYAVLFALALIAGAVFGSDTASTPTEPAPVVLTDSVFEDDFESAEEMSGGLIVSMAVIYIGFLWIGLALQVKRWHDRDKSGWMVLVNLIPLVGGIWALVECGFLSGTPGPNLYGPDPLAR